MNRFRTRRKAKAAETEGLYSPGSAGKLIKRGKTNASPPSSKSQVDLSVALPSSDDFRTSLLMTSMSARFSMLREQDDPNSKLGKASDDSVLSPKRVSRLGDFGFTPSSKLSDIDETSSIKGSFHPPFATTRSESFNSDTGYGTDDDSQSGSIMGRSRPGEGNNLFGGRQKIYKIPVASANTSLLADSGPPSNPVGGRTMGGRVLYENDVSLSAFQKQRERERQREKELERIRTEQDLISTSDWLSRESAPSPTQSGYNRNRETTSSTNSGPSGRTSTAATSIASQGASSIRGGFGRAREEPTPHLPTLERTRSRRLYETGLDRQLHDQQSSAMTRLDQISRQRALGGTPPPGIMTSLSQANSATNLHERFDRIGQSAPNTRPASPPPSGRSTAVGGFDFGLHDSKSTSPIVGLGPKLPLSPPMSDGDSSISFANGSDRGKSNLGPFQRPSQEYDDQQYSERQILMQQGRNSPESPPRTAAAPPTQRSRSESANRRRALQFDGFKISDAPKHADLLGPGHLDVNKPFLSPASISDISSHGESETEGEKILSEFESNRPSRLPINQTMTRPDDADHPAFRQSAKMPLSPPPGQERSSIPVDEKSFGKDRKSSTATIARFSTISGDSPTLGEGIGLSGLVRQHLRNQSNTSSNYADPSSPVTSRFFADDFTVSKDPSRLSSHSIFTAAGNPWGGPGDEKYLSVAPSSPPIPGFMPSPLSVASSSFRNSNKTSSEEETKNSRALSPSANGPLIGLTETDDKLKASASTPSHATNGGPVQRLPDKPKRPISPLQQSKSKLSSSTGDDYWKQEEEKIIKSVVRNQPPKIPSPQARRQERRAQELKLRGMNDQSRKPQMPRAAADTQDRVRSGSESSQSYRHRDGSNTMLSSTRSESPRKPSEPSPVLSRPAPDYAASSNRARSNSNSSSQNYFSKPLHPLNTGSSLSLASSSHSPRPSPLTPFSANSTPPLDDLPTSASSNIPSNPPNFSQSAHPASFGRTKPVNKADISEPSFLHTTNPMTNAVHLPPGTSLSNGSIPYVVPPIPPINPRRRHNPAQAVLSAFSSSSSSKRTSPPTPLGGRSASAERSAFDEDDEGSLTSFRARIRKISSDGGTLRLRAAGSPPTAPPPLPRGVKSPSPPPLIVHPLQQRPVAVDGGMF
ncbi:MAG: hypothetical protein M1814_003401 [Vezdaea aestivalis]|nr:MAG: hypothetical protein M1814_003401 [Vezdaea aestivalis]